jgi:hypothetical protein
MAEKPGYQNFQTSWNKTLNWAHGQGITTNSVLPVYEMDAKRFVGGGYTMSEAERIRAILASENPNNVTPLPTDQPAGGFMGFFHNLEHDASNIFTGLQPTHLVSSIFDSVKNTVEHPGWLFDPTKNTIAQLVPGVSLIGEFEQGGIDNVLAHPLITALNVLALGSGVTDIIGHTAMGDVLAQALKLPGGRTAIGGRAGLGPLGIARKAVGNIETNKLGFSIGPEGMPDFGKLTVSSRVKNWANTKGMGSDVADIAQEVHGASQKASSDFKQLVADFTVANAKYGNLEVTIKDKGMADLFSAQVGDVMPVSKAFYNLLTLSGKPMRELRMNDSIPVPVKELLEPYRKAQKWLEKVGLASGKLVKLQLDDGTWGVFRADGPEARAITGAQARFDKAEKRVDDLGKEADRWSKEIQQNDARVQPGLNDIANLGARIGEYIKRPLSSELRTTLLPTDLADRDWHELGLNHDTVSALLNVGKATLTQGRVVKDIFGPGGLIQQIATAYEREDFKAFRDLSLKLTKKLESQSLMGARAGGAAERLEMSQLRIAARSLYTYGKKRQEAEVKFSRALGGKYATAKKGALHGAVTEFKKAQDALERAIRNNPAPVWQPKFVDLVNEKLATDEETALAVDRAIKKIGKRKNLDKETLKRIRQDPAKVIAVIRTYMDASLESPFGASVDRNLIEEAFSSARYEIVSLRAQGYTPHYVPNFSSRNDLGGYEPGEGTYNVYINPAQYSNPDFVRDRLMDQSNTVYDVYAGMTRAMKQQIGSDATQSVIDDYLIPTFGYKQSEIIKMIKREHPDLGLAEAAGTPQAYLAHIMETTYGLGRFDPSVYGLSSGSRHITGGDTIWMPKAIIQGLRDVTEKGQLEAPGVVRGATRVFRTAVLGYSPRFVAHILFGGSFLVALREPASFLKIPEAFRMLKDPDFRAQIHTRSTQVGADSPVAYGAMAFHEEGGKTMGRMWAQEMMDKLGLDPSKITSWLQVIPQMTFKLTNTITDMQRAQIVLAGIGRAQRHGLSYPEALDEGISAANKVMGDLSHMTPLERNVITTVVPFYGWTKHVLQYVATYPVDHPYRAVFLANLANLNSDAVSKGLYTRIQNLFFLGSPDAQGNVSAIDVRALNPLRDVANYATLGGLISMLNPVISAPFAMVDPEAVFGSNVLYPNLSYNQLYGTETAAPAGSWVTAVEQFVPEVGAVGAVDAALGQSAQYRNLAKTNPNSFAKQIFGALNIPFAQVQHVNLKQIAATQEIDRYRQASAAAQTAWQSGDFSGLEGYGAVPNPLQADYNISPAQLAAIYQASLRQMPGIPPSEAVAPLPTPPGL